MYRNTVQNPQENVLKDKSSFKCKQNGSPTMYCAYKANALGMIHSLNSTLDFKPN